MTNANRCSYNGITLPRPMTTSEDMMMREEEAEALVKTLTYEEKLMLFELLSTLKQKPALEPSPAA